MGKSCYYNYAVDMNGFTIGSPCKAHPTENIAEFLHQQRELFHWTCYDFCVKE